MRLKFFNKLLAIATSTALLATSFSTVPANTVSAADTPGTVTRVSVHDPSIVKANDTYYVFGSHLADAKSTDLMKWTQMHRDWSGTRNWQTSSIYGDILNNLAESFEWAGYDDGDCSNGGLSVWAPDIYYNKDYVWEDGSTGAYMAYYSATSTWRRSCIGYAVSKNVEGPYEYVDTIIYSGFTKNGATDGNSTRNTKWDNDYLNLSELIENGTIEGISDKWFSGNNWNANYGPNAIDATIFDDKDGKLYITYGSWSGGIFILELDPATGAPKYPGTDGTDSVSGNFVDRYFGTHIAGGNHQSGEGPFILYDEETDYFYLYETYGGLAAEGGYNMRLFRSKNVYGPYLDAAGRNAKDSGSGNDRYGIKLIGNYQFTGQKGYRAAGHNSALIDDDGQRYLFYHQRFVNSGEYHEVRTHQQFMNEDNWPVTAVYEYRGETIDHYTDDEVLGTYEIIDHGTTSDGNMLATQVIELREDGKIIGDVTGTWKKSTGEGKDYDYITMNIGTTTYKGIFYKQFNESSKNVMTFSVIGDNNTSVWGTKTTRSITTPSEGTLIYGFNFENNATSGKLYPVASSSKTTPAELIGTASIVEDATRGKVLQITNTAGAKGVNYLRLPSNTFANVTNKGYTISMWINVGASVWEHSALFEANGGGVDQYPLTRMGVNLLSRINAGNAYSDSETTNYTLGEWHHVAYSVTSSGIKVYLDGTLTKTTSVGLTNCFNSSLANSIHKATNVCIGSGYIWNDEDIRDAKFDDVRIYDGALTEDAVSTLYEALPSTEVPHTAATPSPKPTVKPTAAPTATVPPSVAPTVNPTVTPNTTEKPSIAPTVNPTAAPTQSPNVTPAPESSSGDKQTAGVSGNIAPKKVKLISAKSTAKKKVTLKWKKAKNATGYEIQYSTKKNFKSAKKVIIKKVKTTKKTIKRLKSKKKYYFRIRPYKKSGGTKVYGAYSNKKNVKVK